MINNNNLLECAESVLNYLINCDEELFLFKTINTPANIKLRKTLEKYNLGALELVEILNNKFHLIENPGKNPILFTFAKKNFICIPFFKKSINLLSRKQKLEKLKDL